MFDPDYGVHPKETLRDELAARGVEPDEEMQAVLDGGTLSDALAERLEAVLGTGAHAWKNLMWQYYQWAKKRTEELEEELWQLDNLVGAYEDEHYQAYNPTLKDIVEFWEKPRPKRSDWTERVADLRAVIEKLQTLYTDEEAVKWLYDTQKLLGDESVVDLIMDGRVGEVLELLDRIEAGAYL